MKKNPYEEQKQKALKQLKIKSMSGDREAIMLLKYQYINDKLTQIMDKIYSSKKPNSEDIEKIIKSFDAILEDLEKLVKEIVN